MDPRTVELLNTLQGDGRDAATLEMVESLLAEQRDALVAAKDVETLTEVSELLELWAEDASDELAARALLPAAELAQQAGDDDGAAAVYRGLGELRIEDLDDLDGGIEAFESALAASASVETMRRLADLYTRRDDGGDTERAAQMLCTLASEVPEAEAQQCAEQALDLAPAHDGALSLLEGLIPEAEHAVTLRQRWQDYVEHADDGPGLDARRAALARADAQESAPPDGPAPVTVPEQPMPAPQPVIEQPAEPAPDGAQEGQEGQAARQPVAPQAEPAAPVVSPPPIEMAQPPEPSRPAVSQPVEASAPMEPAEPPQPIESQHPSPVSFASPISLPAASLEPSGAKSSGRGLQVGGAVLVALMIGAFAFARSSPNETMAASSQTVEKSEVEAPKQPDAAAAESPPPPGPNPRVRTRPKQLRMTGGKLPKAKVVSAIRRRLASFNRCYKQALQRQSNIAGRIVFRVEVKTNGRVGEVERLRGTITEKRLERCAIRVLKNSRFPKPDQSAASLTLPLVFRK